MIAPARQATRIALIGMGKMGRTLEALAAERGLDVVAKLDHGDAITRDALADADVAIEFTEPGSAVANIRACAAAGVPVVVGTTGWYEQLAAVAGDVLAADGRMLWASNFSIGVNAFRAIVAAAGRVLREAGFDAHLVESHHTAKKDAPSGTAITLRDDAAATYGREIPTTSVRVGSVPGTHTLIFDAPFEQIVLQHEARDRRVFAEGALVAARWLAARGGAGVYTMHDVLAPAPDVAAGGSPDR